jgi:hypothetical protein
VTPEASLKKRWKNPLRDIAVGLFVTVVGGVILWLILRPFDKPTPSTVMVIEQPRSQPQLQPQPEAPTSIPATTPPSQAAPAKKSPPQTTQHAKPQQDNSVHIGEHTSVSQSSSGDCSPNIIGGSPTVNCGPPPPPPLQYTWSIQDVKSETPAYKFAKAISVQTNIVSQPVFIGVIADGEIEDLTVCCGVFLMQSIGHDTRDDELWGQTGRTPFFLSCSHLRRTGERPVCPQVSVLRFPQSVGTTLSAS